MKYHRPARVLALVLSFFAVHLATADGAGAWRTNITAAIDCDGPLTGNGSAEGWTVTFENTEPDRDRYFMDVTLTEHNETVTVAPGESHTFYPISSTTVIEVHLVARWTDGRRGVDRWTVTRPVLTGECHPNTTTTAAPPTTTTEQPPTTTAAPPTTTVPPTSTTVQIPSTTAPPSTTEPPVSTTVQTCADLGYEITDLDGSCYDAPVVTPMPDPVPVVATPTFTG